tara:strand:- start:1305 stop:1832 length:528 start_codon:yes stop_codon:yes gene_type:complete
MIEELIGWALAIFLLTIIFSLIRKFSLGRKANKNDILISDSDVNHLGPFSGQFKFSKKKNILIFLTFINLSFVEAAEKDINEAWCSLNNGIAEFRTKDGTYVDCLTDEYAIEVEFDYNWKEAIGQSLHYAETTQKKPAILFIQRQQSNKDYLNELQRTILKFELPIKVFIAPAKK